MRFADLRYSIISFIFLFFVSLLLSAEPTQAFNDWKPISPEEVSMKTPKVEKDADAEAIFWEIRLDDSSSSDLAYQHYIRVKVFTERGREKFSKIDIPFLKGKKVKDVAARIIKPDGTIVDLKKDDIFEREIIKAGGIKIKAKSFAVPNIEPGVILEYKYREIFQDNSASGERLIFQRDIPIQKISYYVKPYSGNNLTAEYFNMEEIKFTKDKKGYYVASLENVPSFKEEPMMPPEDQVRSWVLLYYTPIATDNQMLNSLVRWGIFSIQRSPVIKDFTKPNKEIKALATELTAGPTTDEVKLQKLYEYTQKNIKNISFDSSITDDERKKIKNNNAGDVLKRKQGSVQNIDLLFASLAQAAGFQSLMVFSGDRTEYFFNPEKNGHDSFVHLACVAVKVGDKWKFFNPGVPYLPYQSLVWNEENTYGILVGSGDLIWQRTPLTSYDKSIANRIGKFKLLEDGTLEGNVKIQYTGHQAISRRRSGYDDSESKRQEDFIAELKEKFSTAEVSNLSIEDFYDNSKPLTYNFKIHIPNYAQKTGKRLFFQPSFFEYGEKPLFSGSTRKYSIHFPYPWSENDDIEFELPEGFSLDNAEAPVGVADPQKVGSLVVDIGITKDKKLMVYTRKFHFGGGGNILFSPEFYQPLKNMFDAFNKVDSHTITLRQD